MSDAAGLSSGCVECLTVKGIGYSKHVDGPSLDHLLDGDAQTRSPRVLTEGRWP